LVGGVRWVNFQKLSAKKRVTIDEIKDLAFYEVKEI